MKYVIANIISPSKAARFLAYIHTVIYNWHVSRLREAIDWSYGIFHSVYPMIYSSVVVKRVEDKAQYTSWHHAVVISIYDRTFIICDVTGDCLHSVYHSMVLLTACLMAISLSYN